MLGWIMSKITRKEGEFLKKSPSVSRKGVLTCDRHTLGKQLRRAAEVTPSGRNACSFPGQSALAEPIARTWHSLEPGCVGAGVSCDK